MYRLSAVLLSLLAAITLLSGCSASGPRVGRAAPRAEEKKPVHAYRLANGFTVLVHSGEIDGPTAVQVWVSDGSACEPPDRPGLSHFIEHMLFEGPPGMPGGKAEDMLEADGGKIEGNTGRDFSYIGVTLPGPGWERAVEILYVLTTSPDFSPEKVEGQREVIALEMDYDATDPERVLMDNLMATAYSTHPYRNPVTGTRESLKAITTEDLASHYSSVFRPSRMTLVVAGDVDPSDVKEVADRSFGTLEVGKPQKLKAAAEPSQISSREVRAEMPVRLTYMAMGWHTCPTSDKDIFALDVLRAVMGLGNGSRLAMELRERKAFVLDVDAQLYAFRDRGVFVINTMVGDADDSKRVREDILRQALKLKTDLVSDEEMERAVLGLEREQMLVTDTAEGKAYALGYWSTVFGGQSLGEYMENIRAVTPEDVRRVAQTYLGEGNYSVSIVGPGRKDRD